MIPFFSVQPCECVAQKEGKGNVLAATTLQGSGAFGDVFKTKTSIGISCDADGEEVAGDGLPPLQFTSQKRLLERTLSHAVFITDEDTGTAVQARGREVISGLLRKSGARNLVAVLLREILLNYRKCPYDLVQFILQKRRTASTLECAACSFALENIAGKPRFQYLQIDFNSIHNNHTRQRYGFLQQLPIKKAIPRVADLTIAKFQQNGGLCFRYAWNNLSTLQEKVVRLFDQISRFKA